MSVVSTAISQDFEKVIKDTKELESLVDKVNNDTQMDIDRFDELLGTLSSSAKGKKPYTAPSGFLEKKNKEKEEKYRDNVQSRAWLFSWYHSNKRREKMEKRRKKNKKENSSGMNEVNRHRSLLATEMNSNPNSQNEREMDEIFHKNSNTCTDLDAIKLYSNNLLPLLLPESPPTLGTSHHGSDGTKRESYISSDGLNSNHNNNSNHSNDYSPSDGESVDRIRRRGNQWKYNQLNSGDSPETPEFLKQYAGKRVKGVKKHSFRQMFRKMWNSCNGKGKDCDDDNIINVTIDDHFDSECENDNGRVNTGQPETDADERCVESRAYTC